jgi:hypothetical protein
MIIMSGIIKRLIISRSQVNTKLHRCINNVVVSESNTRKDILNVFLHGEVDATRHGRYFSTMEVTKGIQIIHQELIIEELLDKVN